MQRSPPCFQLSHFNADAYAHLPTLAKSDFAWEFLRRNPKLRKAAIACRAGAPAATRIAPDTLLFRLRRRFDAARSWGLYWIPDPRLNAMETTPFWRPDRLETAPGLDFAAARKWAADRLELNQLPGRKYVLLPQRDTPQLILRSPCYAGHFMLDGRWTLLPHTFFLDVRLTAFRAFTAQLDGARALIDIVRDRHLPNWRGRAFGPERLRRALIAYDVRKEYRGSHWDVARVLYGSEEVEWAQRRGTSSPRDRARRAFKMGERFVRRDWIRLLA